MDFHARITHNRTERSCYPECPTSSNSAELMPCSEIDHFLGQRHVVPCRPLAVLGEHDLIQISSFPAYMCSFLDTLRLGARSLKTDVTRHLSCSNRRPEVSPAMINEGTTTITTPNAFSDGGKFR
jgi:hypothetical protein